MVILVLVNGKKKQKRKKLTFWWCHFFPQILQFLPHISESRAFQSTLRPQISETNTLKWVFNKGAAKAVNTFSVNYKNTLKNKSKFFRTYLWPRILFLCSNGLLNTYSLKNYKVQDMNQNIQNVCQNHSGHLTLWNRMSGWLPRCKISDI